MKCAENGERDPVETTTSRQAQPLAEGWGRLPISKVFNEEMFLSKGRTGTENEIENEDRASQGLAHLGIHHVCRHQTKYCCHRQEAHAHRNLVWWSLGRSGQQLTNAGMDAWNQPTDLAPATWWGSLSKDWRSRPHATPLNNIGWHDHPVLPESRPPTTECTWRDLWLRIHM